MAVVENIHEIEFAGRAFKFSLPTKEGVSLQNSAWRNELRREKSAALDLVARIDSGTFIDLGAGLGQHAIAVAGATSADVYAFESSREYEPLLRTNIDLNRLSSRITVNQVEEETLSIREKRRNPIRFASSCEDAFRSPQNEIPNLDSMQFMLPITALRVNTPGREIEVLENADNTIRRFLPSIYLLYKGAEIDPLVRSKLVALGYLEVTRFEQCSTCLFQPLVRHEQGSTAEIDDSNVTSSIDKLIENLERNLAVLLDQRKNVQQRKASLDAGERESSSVLVDPEDDLTPEQLRSRINDLSFDILRTTDLIASLKSVVQRSVDRISSMLNDQTDLLDNLIHRENDSVTEACRKSISYREYEQLSEELLTTNSKLDHECKNSIELQTKLDRATSCLYMLENKIWQNSLDQEKVFAEFQSALFQSVEEILQGHYAGNELAAHSEDILQHLSASPASGALETRTDEQRVIEEKNAEMSRRITALKKIVLRKDRELDDYRTSSSFMIGRYIVSVSRNPLKLLLFPGLLYRILQNWVQRRSKIRN